MFNRKYFMTAVIVAITAINVSQAQTAAAPASGTSETQTEMSFFERLGQRIGINYFGVVTGPGLGTLNQSTTNLYSTDNNGQPNPMNLYNELRLDIKTGGRFNIRLNNRFEIYPTTDAGRVSSNGEVSGAILKNFRYGIVGLIVDPTADGFSMASSIALELPTSIAAQTQRMIIAPRVTLNPNIDLSGTRWSLGAFLTGETFFFGSNNPGNNDLYLYFGPYANYGLTDPLQATFQVDADTFHKMSGIFAPNAMDIQLGVNWDVSKKLSINPFIQIFPENISLRTSFIGANISATLL